jgi:hypothetical protein
MYRDTRGTSSRRRKRKIGSPPTKSASGRLNDCRESLIEVVFAAFIYHVDDIELKPVRAGRGFSVGDFGLTEGIVGINEVVDDGGRRKARSSDVAARPIEASNKAQFDGVAAADENDGDSGGDRFDD